MLLHPQQTFQEGDFTLTFRQTDRQRISHYVLLHLQNLSFLGLQCMATKEVLVTSLVV